MNFGQLKSRIRDTVRHIESQSNAAGRFRILNYLRVLDMLDSYYDDHTRVSKEKINTLNLTEHMRAKLLDFACGTKTDKVISKARKENKESKDRAHLLTALLAIKGIGRSRAQMLISRGLTSVAQLKRAAWQELLTEETRVFLSLKPAHAIPHEEIQRLEPRILNVHANVKLVGSARRKKKYSRDLDVMVVDKNQHALETFLNGLAREFGAANVVPYARGNDKLSVMLIFPDKKKVYKLDAFRVDPAAEISMLLYSTGSKAHNIAMRSRAKRMGYLLNQHGLFALDSGAKVPGLRAEEDYFRALNMPYKKPEERI